MRTIYCRTFKYSPQRPLADVPPLSRERGCMFVKVQSISFLCLCNLVLKRNNTKMETYAIERYNN